MKGVQYTLRDVPGGVDRALRLRARANARSLNAVAVEVLAAGLGIGEAPVLRHDLDDFAGTWVPDPACVAALKAMDRVDKDLWR
jgi:hypothetical protein